jgi:hypothetical protein
MTNSDDNKSYREVRQETHTDNDGNTNTNVTRSSETVDNSTTNSQSYQSGYVQGRSSERNYEEALKQRDDENTNRGLLIGVVLAGLAALIGSAFWYFNQSSQTVDTTIPTTSTPITSPSPAAIQTPQPQQTTIIERTKEVPVQVPVTVEKTKEVPVFIPVPQQKAAPAPSVNNNNKAPNINITVPPQQPAAKQTPAAQVSPAPSSSSNTSNSTSSTTPATSQSSDKIPSDIAPASNSTTEKSN